MYSELQKRLYLAIFALTLIIIIGTIGFKFFGGSSWSILDAMYMTIITITTVGYGETHSLSGNPGARIFTIFLLLFGTGVLLYGIGNATAFIIEGDLKHLMWRRRIMKKIIRLSNHYIICGAGEIGIHVIDEMMKTRQRFVVIEKSMDIIEHLRSRENLLIVHGDATDDDTLLNAGIEQAVGIISTIHSDKDNLFITVSARQLNHDIRIVAHAIDPATQKKLFKSGADAVVSANVIGALRMVSEMIRPTVVNFLDQMLRIKDKCIRIEEVTIKENSAYIGQSLAEANIGKETGVLLIAMRNVETNQFTYSFASDLKLKLGDILVVIGSVDQVMVLRQKAGYDISQSLDDQENNNLQPG
ncbi:potassium channel family protein [candidate division CSSED10-310 bacterium]|uniref:Potassium channel family protein n=1 Tax=candidate division CSSED10-310 bacterium TaxID=2855610 RepID=A0ABV6YR16_UNCC1